MTATTIKTCPNGLRKTVLVSFPRSGHHLLVRGLTEALDHKLVYSEYYSCAHNMSNCEYVNLQKSHDFDLSDPIDPELNYIVLWRGFEDATLSWWKASETSLTLEEFRKSKRVYYDGFMAKWVTGSHHEIEYQDFSWKLHFLVAKSAEYMGGAPNHDKLVDFVRRESRLTPAIA